MQDQKQTKRTFVPVLAILMIAALLLTPLIGCKGGNKREEWVADAENRWLTLRSNMMLDMARQQFETGDLEIARHTLGDAMEIDPGNARLHVLVGRIELEEGRLERAFHRFNLAQELDENEAEAFYYQGVVLQRWQRFDPAEQAYRRAYELRSDQVGYLLAVSEMVVERGDLDEALSLLIERLDYFDQSAALRAQIGYLYNLQNRPNRAVPFFEEASLMDSENLKLREELALAQFAAGDNKSAVATLESLLDEPRAQERRDLQRTLARAYLELGRRDLARATYLRLARSERGEAGDWLRLGQLAWQDNDLGSALQAAHQVMQRSPERYEGYLLAGMVWHKRGRLDDALSMFDRAVDRAGDRTEPLIMRGLSLQSAGRTAAAREAFQRALELNPNDERAQRLLRALDASAAVTP